MREQFIDERSRSLAEAVMQKTQIMTDDEIVEIADQYLGNELDRGYGLKMMLMVYKQDESKKTKVQQRNFGRFSTYMKAMVPMGYDIVGVDDPLPVVRE